MAKPGTMQWDAPVSEVLPDVECDEDLTVAEWAAREMQQGSRGTLARVARQLGISVSSVPSALQSRGLLPKGVKKPKPTAAPNAAPAPVPAPLPPPTTLTAEDTQAARTYPTGDVLADAEPEIMRAYLRAVGHQGKFVLFQLGYRAATDAA